MNNKLTFKRLLDTFVPGFIVVFGIWYLFRSYLQKYFPTIAFDAGNDSFSSELKLIAFLTIVLFFGILINHLSDISIALIYESHDNTKDKSLRPFKKTAKSIFGFFVFSKYQDPRVHAIDRYLVSSRKELFTDLIKDWTGIDKEQLESEKEKIVTHQHLCIRLKLISELTEKNLDDAFSEVAFSASLFTAFFMTFFITVIAIIFNYTFPIELKIIEVHLLYILLLIEYLICILLNYSLRRRFRHFCSQIVTICLNQYLIERYSLKKRCSLPNDKEGQV